MKAVFVCGTTGEGPSLSTEERKQVAEAWKKCTNDDFSLIVHVGSTSLDEARCLSRHAESIGASAFAAFAPFFFRPRSVAELVEWCAAVASSAPSLPFYFYHIPSMTEVRLAMADFLKVASRVPNLAGIKYTHEDLQDYEECIRHAEGRFDILFGRDEMLLEGWIHGARGAVGSTYNYAAPLYLELLASLNAGNSERARELQDKSIGMIRICNSIGVTHLAASKALMAGLGVNCGPVRLPLMSPESVQLNQLHAKLKVADLFDMIY